MKPASIFIATLLAAQTHASDLELSDTLLDSVSAGGVACADVVGASCYAAAPPEQHLETSRDLLVPGLPGLPERMKGILRPGPTWEGNQAKTINNALWSPANVAPGGSAATPTPDRTARPQSASALLQQLLGNR